MPWMKQERDYIDHAKFLALSDGAFRLWHEGKCYAERFLTDGLLPDPVVRSFRSYSAKRVKELSTVLGGYEAPLWEPVGGGYRMHDYLRYNDCRQKVEARMSGQRERTKRHRTSSRNATSDAGVTRDIPDVTRPSHDQEAETETEAAQEAVVVPHGDVRTDQQQGRTRAPTGSRVPASKKPIFTGNRLTVWPWQMGEICRILGDHAVGFNPLGWLASLDAAETGVIDAGAPSAFWREYLRPRLMQEIRQRGLPVASDVVISATSAPTRPLDCPHTPRCGDAASCGRLKREALKIHQPKPETAPDWRGPQVGGALGRR